MPEVAQVYLLGGTRYRGRIIVFYPVAPEKTVKQKLEATGFTDVQVWSNSESLPADWPKQAKEDVADFGYTQVFVEGNWSKPSGMYPDSGSDWQIYDYWPKDSATPVQANEVPSSNWKVYAVMGSVALFGVIMLITTAKD